MAGGGGGGIISGSLRYCKNWEWGEADAVSCEIYQLKFMCHTYF